MHKYFCLVIIISCFNVLNAQNRAQLEQQRNTLIKQIDKTSETLKLTEKNRAQTLRQYDLLESQIENRKTLIENLNSSLSLVEDNLSQKEGLIDSLQENYIRLKESYMDLLQIQLRKKYLDKPWMILLSAQSLNEAMTKWRYFQQFKEHFNQKSNELIIYQTELQNLVDTLSVEKENKIKLIEIENEQAVILDEEKQQKDKLLKTLSESEKRLKLSLNRQKQQREELNKTIENIIIREMEMAKKAKASKIDESATGLDFNLMKGKMNWPLTGKIIAWFGKHDHPEMKNVVVENNGIDIAGSKGQKVKSVFEGTVVTVSQIPGHQNMVMIQHDSYFTVYTKLGVVNVVPGDKVSAQEVIGSVYTNDKNQSTLHFEIWKGKKKENPSQWLKL